MEYYSASKNEDILSFADKWMELENNILSEVTPTQKDMHVCNHSLVDISKKEHNTQYTVHRTQKVQQAEGPK